MTKKSHFFELLRNTTIKNKNWKKSKKIKKKFSWKNFLKSGGSLLEIVKKNSQNKKNKKIKKVIVCVIVQKARFFVMKSTPLHDDLPWYEILKKAPKKWVFL